jgi:peptidoglycan/xylan/chitin deacetylase (PgdA/CDA1 family)
VDNFVEGMSDFDIEARRSERAQQRRRRHRRRRFGVLGALVLVVAIVIAIVVGAAGGSSRKTSSEKLAKSNPHRRAAQRVGPVTPVAKGTGKAGKVSVPILMYHVINPPPARAPFPGLYVPSPEFAAQMQALKHAGYHAVTLDQLLAYWTRGVPLGHGKPIVLTFDNGYQSQYTNALPVLKQLGWAGVENIQLTGLPPAQGGLTETQVKGLISDGWELDTQGISHADLTTLDTSELRYQIEIARQELRSRYGVPVEWFCYPSGHYDATVVAAVRAAGFVGSTTVVPGWASGQTDRYRLPRLRVLGGTSPSALLAQIAGAEGDGPAPPSYNG